MIRTALLLSGICIACRASGVVQLQAAQPVTDQVIRPPVQVGPPTVLASSSQYFERTFNHLVAAPPAIPLAPTQPVFTVQPVVRTSPGVIQPAAPTQPFVPNGNNPNVAIAIATAHAAAPVATILLPPYPFAPPQALGFIHPINVPDEPKKRDPEPTTTTQRTILRQPETTSVPNNPGFGQGSPSDQNVEFNQYYVPPVAPLPLASANPPKPVKPIKLRTSVEIVPVPLTYIAPPPLKLQEIRHIHTFVPTKARIIIRPAVVRQPARLFIYRRPITSSRIVPQPTLRRSLNRDIEPTTFSPQRKPITKPPRR